MSRIAKMGQPMLPLAGAVPARIDSEEESLVIVLISIILLLGDIFLLC